MGQGILLRRRIRRLVNDMEDVMDFLRGMKVVKSEGVAPSEVIMLGANGTGVRWTFDSGVEELSEYQIKEIKRSISEV